MLILFRDSLANAKQPPLNLNGLGLYYVAARLTRNKSEDSSCKATSSFKNRNLPQAKGGDSRCGAREGGLSIGMPSDEQADMSQALEAKRLAQQV
jgi:hypothetical protein